MSGIAGIVSLTNEAKDKNIDISFMCKALSGSGIVKTYESEWVSLGCSNPLDNHSHLGTQPITAKSDDCEYTIVFSGAIYNYNSVKGDLIQKRHTFNGHSHAELVLKAYIEWGGGCLNRLNGVFSYAVWNSKSKELFIARDRFGIKPFYYMVKDNCLLFSSEIKGLLAHPRVEAVLDKQGISEIFGLGPAHTQGCGIFKDIYEIKPAHCATYNKNGFNTYRYWSLESNPHRDDFETTVENVKAMVTDAIHAQINTKSKLCGFLSGGLDSSLITAISAKKSKEKYKTFSVQYENHEKDFTPTDYQNTSDEDFIKIMSEKFETEHTVISLTARDLFDNLVAAAEARSVPGMGDVDSSLLCFCRAVSENYDIALSGECADEVFGGYPWFHREEDFSASTFPWSKNLEFREKIINPNIAETVNVIKYINEKYKESIHSTAYLPGEDSVEKRRREIAHLNLNWFMYTLGERSERIGNSSGLEIRMPFCDHRLVEYAWNIPWEMKAYKGREKGLLRKVAEDLLPEEIVYRKKSPYPKTFNPEYEKLVLNRVKEILNNKSSKILEIINVDYIQNLMGEKSDYGKPWFGQLMATPQLYAYIIQTEEWLQKYKVRINL